MYSLEDVAVFWDYENCPIPSNTSGYSIVDNIRSIARPYGSVKSFKAYLEISDQAQRSMALRSELQSSGVSLVDCPHNGRKDVADKMIIVDMFAHAIDTPAPSTVVLITGDRDFAYAVSTLRLRRYRVVLLTLSNAHASLTAQASICLDWTTHASNIPKQAALLTSQEKSRSSGMPNPQTGFPQVVHDATEDRLAPVLQSGQGSIDSISNFSRPIPESTSAGKTFISDTSFRKQPIDFPVDTLDILDDKSTTANHVDDQRELFIQPLLNQHILPDPSLEADPGSTSPSTLFLPSILTGSSSRTRTLPSSKISVEPIQPPLARVLETHPTDHMPTQIPPTLISIEPNPISIQRPMPNKNATLLLPLPRLPDIVSPSRPSAHPIARQTSGDSNSSYSTSPQQVAVGQSTRGGGPIVPKFVFPSSLLYTPPSTKDGDLDVVFTTAAEYDNNTRGLVPGLEFELPASQTSSQPISPRSKTSEFGSISSSSPFTNSDSSSAIISSNSTVPEVFRILVECLQYHFSKGNPRPLRGVVALQISNDRGAYAKAGVTNFGQYVTLAEEQGIIELGGAEAWISLRPDWCNTSTSAAAEVEDGSPPSVSDEMTLLTSQRNTIEFSQSHTSISCPSSPLYHPSVVSSDADSDSNLALTTSISLPVDSSLEVEEPIVEHHGSSAETVPLSATETPLQPVTSSIPTSLNSDSSPNASSSLPVDECTNGDSGTAFATLLITEPQPAPSVTKSDIEVPKNPPTETPPLPNILIDPLTISLGENHAVLSSPVDPPSKIGDSATDTSSVTPVQAKSVSLPNVVLRPPPSVTTTAPSPQIVKGSSSSGISFSAVVKGSASVPQVPSPIMQPQPALSIPAVFKPLIECLQAHKLKGYERPLRSTVSYELYRDGSIFMRAGVGKFSQYAALAERSGVIELGGTEGHAWISLKPNLSDSPSSQPEVPEIFKVLVQCLQAHRSKGIYCPTRSELSIQVNKNGTTYRKAGVTKFKYYVALAEKAGIVELG
ncbi:NYN domain-containing protein, partial [Gymnopilus junonius]